VLLITPWDRIASVARHHYPGLPVGWVLRDDYDSIANLAGYPGRVAVVVAERDSIIPPALGRRLFASLAEPKRLWVVPAADHNDWLERVDAAWWDSVVGFLGGGENRRARGRGRAGSWKISSAPSAAWPSRRYAY